MKLSLSLLLAAGLSLQSAAQADVIVPASWKQSNSFNNLRLAANLSNATGMSPDGTFLYNLDGSLAGDPNFEPATADNSAWMTSSKGNRANAMSAGRVWIVADLGAAYNLTSIHIWNFSWDNTPGTAANLTDRGVNQFDILVRNTAADTSDGSPAGTAINLNNQADDATNALDNDVIFALGTENSWTAALDDQVLTRAPNTDDYTGQSFSLAGQTARFIAIRVDSHHGGTGGIGLGKVRIEGTAAGDTIPPALVARTPADDTLNAPTGGNLVATFSEAVQPGTGSITIRRTSDNSVVETFDVATSPRVTFSVSQVTIDPTASLATGAEYYVQIDATAIKDLANNAYAGIVSPDTTTWNFTTDSIAPLLLSTFPSDDTVNVAANANLVATFDEPVRPGTGSISVRRSSDSSVVESFDVATAPQITFAGANVTINPTADLQTGVDHYVQIDATAITDASGNAYSGLLDPSAWSFTTDATAPMLISFSPATPTLAHTGSRLMLQFDEAVQAGTGTVTIRKSSDNSVVETIDVTSPGAVVVNGRVLAIVRTVPLAPATDYYVTISDGAIQDLSGIASPAISGSAFWTFKTASAVPLVVENFSGASDPLNGTLAETFSDAILNAGGSAAWGAASGFRENGAVSGTTSSAAFLNLGSYINDTKGTAAGKFELVMTIAEVSGASWFSMGFVGSSAPSTTGNFTNLNGVATIIYRGQGGVASPNTSGELDMFGGLTNTNAVDGPDNNTGFRTLTVSLDFTPAGGFDGAANFGTVSWSDSVLGVLASYTYPTSRSFNSILLTQAATSTTINALALYQTGSAAPMYADWINGFSVGGLTEVNDDFDRDGLGNAVENLMGTAPDAFNAGLTPSSGGAGTITFRHTRSAAPANDLTGTYEWSADLTTWQGSGAAAGGTTVTFAAPVIVTAGTPDLVEVTATVTGTPAPRIFVRFKATQN